MERIELQLDNTVFILGAGITALLKHEDEKLPPVSFKLLKNILLQLDNPAVQSNLVQSRLEEIFTDTLHQPSGLGLAQKNRNSLADFQRQGALLAYLYPDKIIDQALDQHSLTATHVDEWVQQSMAGIMHLFGVYSDLDSMQCLKDDRTIVPDSLLHVFKHKVCVCVGFDHDGQTDLEAFLNQLPLKEMPQVLLPCVGTVTTTIGLPISVTSFLEKLYPIGNNAKILGAKISHSAFNDRDSYSVQPLSLLMAAAAKKADYMKTAELLSTLPGLSLQLMNSIEHDGSLFPVLTVQVKYRKFLEFWSALMEPNMMDSLVDQTVLAIVPNQFTFIWLRTAGGPLLSMTTLQPASTTAFIHSSSPNRALSRNQLAKSSPMLSSSHAPTISRKNEASHHPRYLVKKVKTTIPGLNNNKTIYVSSIYKCNNPTSQPSAIMNNSNIHCGDKRTNATIDTMPNMADVSTNRYNPRVLRAMLRKQQSMLKEQRHKGVGLPQHNQVLRKLLSEPVATKTASMNLHNNERQMPMERNRHISISCLEWSRHMKEMLKRKATEKDRTNNAIRDKQTSAGKIMNHHHALPRSLSSSFDGSGLSVTSQPSSLHQEPSATPIAPQVIPNPALALQQSTTMPVVPPSAAAINPYIMPTIPPPTQPIQPLRTTPAASLYTTPYLSPFPFLPTTPAVNFPYLFRNPFSLLLNTPPAVQPSCGSSYPPTGIGHNSYSLTGSSQAVASLTNTANASPPTMGIDMVTAARQYSDATQGNQNPPFLGQQLQTTMSPSAVTHHFNSSPSPSSGSSTATNGDGDVSDSTLSSDHHMSCDSPPDEITDHTEEESLPLWKFIVELLLLRSHSHLMNWTQVHLLEFQIKQPLELVRVWSLSLNKPTNDSANDCYPKFRKAMHYYSMKNQPIIRCISVRDEIYRFSDSMHSYINDRYLQLKRNNEDSMFNFTSLERLHHEQEKMRP